MKLRKKSHLLIFGLLLLAISACGPKAAQTPSPGELTQAALFADATITSMAQQTQASLLQTQQSIPSETATPTATQPPIETVTPTATLPENTAANTTTPTESRPPAEQIFFASNATQFSTQGTTTSAESKRYILGAGEDQLLDVVVMSAEEVAISIVGADGTVLLSPMGDAVNFRGALPSTQDYIITVRTTAASANFQLNIMIPARIVFEAGEDTWQTDAPAIPDAMNRQYTIYALAGQTLSVEVTPIGSFALTIYGADGTVLMSGNNTGSVFSGTLPSNQYYIISVSAAPGVSTGYTLTVTAQ